MTKWRFFGWINGAVDWMLKSSRFIEIGLVDWSEPAIQTLLDLQHSVFESIPARALTHCLLDVPELRKIKSNCLVHSKWIISFCDESTSVLPDWEWTNEYMGLPTPDVQTSGVLPESVDRYARNRRLPGRPVHIRNHLKYHLVLMGRIPSWSKMS